MNNHKEQKEKYISLQEAAQVYGCTQKHMNLMARKGKLRAIKMGRNWVTTFKWLEEYSKSLKTKKKIKKIIFKKPSPVFKKAFSTCLISFLVFLLISTAFVAAKQGGLSLKNPIKHLQSPNLISARAFSSTAKVFDLVFHPYYEKYLANVFSEISEIKVFKTIARGYRRVDKTSNQFFGSIFKNTFNFIGKVFTVPGRLVINIADNTANFATNAFSTTKKIFVHNLPQTLKNLFTLDFLIPSYPVEITDQSYISIKDLYRKLSDIRDRLAGERIIIQETVQRIVKQVTIVKPIEKEVIKEGTILADWKQGILSEVDTRLSTLETTIYETTHIENIYYYAEAAKAGGFNTVNNDVDFNEDVDMNKSLTVLGSLTVAGGVSFTGTSTFTGTAAFSGAVTIADDLTVDTNTLFVDASNNYVGINTITPSVELSIIGTASISEDLLASGSVQFGGGEISTVSYSRFGTADTTHSLADAYDLLITGLFEVDSNAYFDSSVGIGTIGAPSYALSVDGTASVSDDFYVGDNLLFVDVSASNIYASASMDIASLTDGTLTIDGSGNITGGDYFSFNNASISDNLTVSDVFTVRDGLVSISDDLYVGDDLLVTHITDDGVTISGDFEVTGNVTLGGATTNTLVVNSYVGSDLVPESNNYDIGSTTSRWRYGWFDEITVATISAVGTAIGGTTSRDFLINSDNATNDTEDSSLTFERGIPTTNAQLLWDYTNTRFDFNYPLYVNGALNVDSTASISDTLTVASGSNIDSGTLYVDAATNRVGIGTISPDETLTVNGNVKGSRGLFSNTTANPIITATQGSATGNIISLSGATEVFSVAYDGTTTIASGSNTDSGTLYVDAGNNDVGIGTTDPNYLAGSGTFLTIYEGAAGSNIEIITNRGDADEAYIGSIRGLQLQGLTNYEWVSDIIFRSDGGTATKRGGAIEFRTQADNDAAGIASRLRIESTGTITIASGSNTDSGTLYVDAATDRVGIGTTDPSDKLTVVGNVNISDSHLELDGDDKMIKLGDDFDYSIGYSDLDDSLHFINGQAIDTDVRMVINPSGYVGIGTGTNTVNYTLSVDGTASISEEVRFMDNVLVVASNSMVGIGTTEPQDVLDVYSGDTGNGGIRVSYGTADKTLALLGSDGVSQDDGVLRLHRNGAVKIHLDSNGDSYIIDNNFGLGDTTPQYTLSVDGTASVSGGLWVDTMASISGDFSVASSGYTSGDDYGPTLYVDSVLDYVGIGTSAPSEKLHIVGKISLIDNDTNNSIYIGKSAGAVSTREGNTFVGWTAGQLNTTGYDNAFFGRNAGGANTTGFGNTFLGARNTGLTNTTGDFNTLIGNDADVASGDLTNATAIGYNAKVGASDSLVLGGTGAYAVNVGIGTTTPSTELSIVGTASISQDLWASGSFQFGGGITEATQSYSRLGGADTGHNLSDADDLLISGMLEVNGYAYFDNVVYFATGGVGMVVETEMRVKDDSSLNFGNSDDVKFLYETAGSHDFLAILTNVNNAVYSGNIVIGNLAHEGNDFDHAISANPTLFIQSATDPDVDNTEWLSFAHDGANASISVGQGGILFSPASASEAVYIDIDGNVGIGTTAPTHALSVVGTSTFDGDMTFGSGGNDSILMNDADLYVYGDGVIYLEDAGPTGAYIESPATDEISFTVASLEAVRIDSNGDVGIGDTAPSYTLSVDGTASISDQAFFMNDVLVVASNSYVGIGTTDPSEKLEVVFSGGDTGVRFVGDGESSLRLDTISPEANARNWGLTTNVEAWGDLDITHGATQGAGIHRATSRLYFNSSESVFNDDSFDIDFRVESDNDQYALFVQGSDGMVGIGDSAPSYTLSVDGTASISEDFYVGDDMLFADLSADTIYSSASWNIDNTVSISDGLSIGSYIDFGTIATPSTTEGRVFYEGGADLMLYDGSTWHNLASAGGSTEKITEGDTSIEIIDTGDGYISFTEDNTEYMRLTGGMFGIGDIVPSYTLSVDGTASISDSLFGSNASLSDGLQIAGLASASSLTIGGTASNLFIDDHGDVVINHTAVEMGDHALELNFDVAGYGGTHGMDINYITGAIETGQDEAAILINIDESSANGGSVVGVEVVGTEGSANLYGIEVGALVNPLLQLSGTFGDMSSASNNGVDHLTEFLATGNDIEMFSSDDDYVIIGDTNKFEEIEFLLEIMSSNPGIKASFSYSVGVDDWTVFSPEDTTNGMRNNGVIIWNDSDVSDWAVGEGTEYLIKIRRTQNNLGTAPTEDKVQIAAVTEYRWDKSGVLSISTLTASGSADNYFAGNLGIGDISPGFKLSVDGTASISDDFYVTGDDVLFRPFADATDAFMIASSGYTVGDDYGPIFNVDTTNERVGIGTNAPSQLLHVKGAAGQIRMETTGADSSPTIAVQNDAQTWRWTMRGDLSDALTLDDETNIFMAIDTSGNVGIGDSSPEFGLEIGASNSAGYFAISGNTTGGGSGDGDIFVVDENKNVGIGTAGPVSALQVEDTGSQKAVAEFLLPDLTDGQRSHIVVGRTTAVGAAYGYGYDTTSGDQRAWIVVAGDDPDVGTGLHIRKGGNVGIGTTSPDYQLELSTNSAGKPTSDAWTIVSDERIKKNIASFTDGLSILRQINPVSYALNGLAGTPIDAEGIGLIAQDIKDIIPYTIGTYTAKLYPEDKEETELYNFNGSALTYIAINAIKEMNNIVDLVDAPRDISSLTIASSGFVGIGTASPSYSLSVDGTASISGDLYVSGKIFAEGGIDPPYMLYDAMTRDEIIELAESIPDNKKSGIMTFYNKDTEIMEFYKPDTGEFINAGSTNSNIDIQYSSTPLDFLTNLVNGLKDLGVTIANGIIEATKLVVDEVKTKVLRANEISIIIEEGKDNVIGRDIFPAQQVEYRVENSLVEENSKIFITFRADIGNRSFHVSEIVPNNGFIVRLSSVVPEQVEFDYWIILVENNEQGTGSSEQPAPYCGDGEVYAGEECDDGNNENGDGCDSTCMNESLEEVPTLVGTPTEVGETITSSSEEPIIEELPTEVGTPTEVGAEPASASEPIIEEEPTIEEEPASSSEEPILEDQE